MCFSPRFSGSGRCPQAETGLPRTTIVHAGSPRSLNHALELAETTSGRPLGASGAPCVTSAAFRHMRYRDRRSDPGLQDRVSDLREVSRLVANLTEWPTLQCRVLYLMAAAIGVPGCVRVVIAPAIRMARDGTGLEWGMALRALGPLMALREAGVFFQIECSLTSMTVLLELLRVRHAQTMT